MFAPEGGERRGGEEAGRGGSKAVGVAAKLTGHLQVPFIPPTSSPERGGQTVFFNRLDLYHTPMDSGERQCGSRA